MSRIHSRIRRISGWFPHRLEALAADPRCVSLGECGLDYDRMFSPRETQLDVFAKQCRLAADLGRALFVRAPRGTLASRDQAASPHEPSTP